MTHKQRFMVIALPEDHDESDLAEVACNLQDMLNFAQVGAAIVFAPIPEALHLACVEHTKGFF